MGILTRTCLVAVAALLAVSQYASAQKPSHDGERARDSDICGYQLMTERERAQYRERIQRGGTGEELERILTEHRLRMQARAKERGVTLSCEKPGEVRQVKSAAAPVSQGGDMALSSPSRRSASLPETTAQADTDEAAQLCFEVRKGNPAKTLVGQYKQQ